MTDQNNSRVPFKVGYGKPPKHSQFAKGKSGNPKGRGKGVRNLSTEIEEELNARIRVTENGTSKKITKRKAIAKRVVNSAVSGDAKAIPVVLNQTRLQEGDSAAGPRSEVLSRAEDELVMANIIRRIREAETPPPDPPMNTSQLEDGNTP